MLRDFSDIACEVADQRRVTNETRHKTVNGGVQTTMRSIKLNEMRGAVASE